MLGYVNINPPIYNVIELDMYTKIYVLLSWFIEPCDLTLKDLSCYIDQSIYIEIIHWSHKVGQN